jgi:hypothetical protein
MDQNQISQELFLIHSLFVHHFESKHKSLFIFNTKKDFYKLNTHFRSRNGRVRTFPSTSTDLSGTPVSRLKYEFLKRLLGKIWHIYVKSIVFKKILFDYKWIIIINNSNGGIRFIIRNTIHLLLFHMVWL